MQLWLFSPLLAALLASVFAPVPARATPTSGGPAPHRASPQATSGHSASRAFLPWARKLLQLDLEDPTSANRAAWECTRLTEFARGIGRVNVDSPTFCVRAIIALAERDEMWINQNLPDGTMQDLESSKLQPVSWGVRRAIAMHYAAKGTPGYLELLPPPEFATDAPIQGKPSKVEYQAAKQALYYSEVCNRVHREWKPEWARISGLFAKHVALAAAATQHTEEWQGTSEEDMELGRRLAFFANFYCADFIRAKIGLVENIYSLASVVEDKVRLRGDPSTYDDFVKSWLGIRKLSQLVQAALSDSLQPGIGDQATNAVQIFEAKVLKLVLTRGCDINSLDPEIVAKLVADGRVDILRVLLRLGLSVSRPYALSPEPVDRFFLAAHEGKSEVVDLFIEQGADAERSEDPENDEPRF